MRAMPFGPKRLEVFDEITLFRGEELKEEMDKGRIEVQAFADARPGGRQGPALKVGWKKNGSKL